MTLTLTDWSYYLLIRNTYLPMTNAFLATSLSGMKTETKASYTYAYMAQALRPGVLTFCLALIETDNCFTNKTFVGTVGGSIF